MLVHIPDKGHVTTRYYYGWYANRPRGRRRHAPSCAVRRRHAEPAAVGAPAIVPAPRLAPTEAARRWAALRLQIFEVDPLRCPTCHGAMRIVAIITQASVIDQILTHRRTCGDPGRAGASRPRRAREHTTDFPHPNWISVCEAMPFVKPGGV